MKGIYGNIIHKFIVSVP